MRVLALTLATGCALNIPMTRPPPARGYGDPYKGTGEPIYVKDSRNDWDITEGKKKITSEQALEAAGDPEYETRRQIAKRHNDELYKQGKARRARGKTYTRAGFGMLLAGLAVSMIVPTLVQEDAVSPASNAMPETRETRTGGASMGALLGGLAVAGIGAGLYVYGHVGGRVQPPYHEWRTPRALDRPAYVREHTEALNEKLGAPPVQEQPGGVEEMLAPGQRKPPPPRPTAATKLKMRGDR